ncbi:hypothetical protein [Demequina sp. SO4-18]|uniref:hypothetical protein n=1 Tax=Demequina sp. SO4-18 TaxID=3401026 RepID=UPI003B58D51B
MLLEVLVDACTACAPSSPPIVPTLAGDVGSPTTGPPPGESDRPGNDSPGDAGPSDDPASDDKPSLWDRFFDSGKDDGSHDVAVDVIKTVGQDVATEVALDIAGKALPAAAGTVGALGTVASGSQTMAEGITIINENQGRGMGGSSESGKAVWEALEQERNYGPRGRRRD